MKFLIFLSHLSKSSTHHIFLKFLNILSHLYEISSHIFLKVPHHIKNSYCTFLKLLITLHQNLLSHIPKTYSHIAPKLLTTTSQNFLVQLPKNSCHNFQKVLITTFENFLSHCTKDITTFTLIKKVNT